LTKGAHALKREILGNKYPRKYSSSAIGPMNPLTKSPRSAVISTIDLAYSNDDDMIYQSGNQKNRVFIRIWAIDGYTTTKMKLA